MSPFFRGARSDLLILCGQPIVGMCVSDCALVRWIDGCCVWCFSQITGLTGGSLTPDIDTKIADTQHRYTALGEVRIS